MGRAKNPEGTFYDLGELPAGRLGRRWVRVYVPHGVDPAGDRRALVMLDGQNVFGDEGSFAGGWHAHDAVDGISRRQHHAPLLVAVGNGGAARLDEMTPFRHRGAGGRADALVGWIADRLAPKLRKQFGILPGPVGLAIAGSSLGGLAAMYAHLSRPDAFGGAVVMSPSLFWAHGRILEYAASRPRPHISRVYLDCGAREGSGQLMFFARRMAAVLEEKGYPREQLLFRPDPRGGHTERNWRRRLPQALRFMYRR